MKVLQTSHGDLSVPAFLPDATRAVVRTLDASDLIECGVRGLVVNTLHLSSHPGTSLVSSLGGTHRFMGWSGPILSDSGGFQVLSLIESSSRAGAATERGFTYRLGSGRKKLLSPENCIQKQFQIGSDVMMCLDHCTHPREDPEHQRISVSHTVEWARRCKETFNRLLDQHPPEGKRPLLFAVVQGGNDRGLRRTCFEQLREIGCDGYGYGGWPIDADGGLVDAVEHVSSLIPKESLKHALGIGKPQNLLRAFRMGYDLFDCAIPTRDARRGRLFVFREPPEKAHWEDDGFWDYLYIHDERYARDRRPLDETCRCLCCRRYSRAYLHHLYRIRDELANRLATIHNLTFYTVLTDTLARGPGP